MSLSQDFLDLAKTSAAYTKNDLLQARLRRATSCAYYALFHFLIEEATTKLFTDPSLRSLTARAYSHNEMVKVARLFTSGTTNFPKPIVDAFGGTVPAIPSEIIDLSNAFIRLQSERHNADYNPNVTFVRSVVQGMVAQVETVINDWRTISTIPTHAIVCELFLSSLLLLDRWKR